MSSSPDPSAERFVDWPAVGNPLLEWPTLNRLLFEEPDRFFAQTRANARYGRPGWTRDCGRRFHRGVDIAPIRTIPTGERVRVIFSDCERNLEFESFEPGYLVDEPVFSVSDGVVRVCADDPSKSTYGSHLIIEHDDGAFRWQSLYAHLAHCGLRSGDRVHAGQEIGRLGQTSSSEEARRWMAIAPHLHFEARDVHGNLYDPEQVLMRGLSRYA